MLKLWQGGMINVSVRKLKTKRRRDNNKMEMNEYKGGHTPIFIKFAEAPYTNRVENRTGVIYLFKIRTNETKLYIWDTTTGDTCIIPRKPLNELVGIISGLSCFGLYYIKGVEYNGKLYK